MSSDAGILGPGFSDLVSLTLNLDRPARAKRSLASRIVWVISILVVHGVGSVEEGGALIPFVLVESKGQREFDATPAEKRRRSRPQATVIPSGPKDAELLPRQLADVTILQTPLSAPHTN